MYSEKLAFLIKLGQLPFSLGKINCGLKYIGFLCVINYR